MRCLSLELLSLTLLLPAALLEDAALRFAGIFVVFRKALLGSSDELFLAIALLYTTRVAVSSGAVIDVALTGPDDRRGGVLEDSATVGFTCFCESEDSGSCAPF